MRSKRMFESSYSFLSSLFYEWYRKKERTIKILLELYGSIVMWVDLTKTSLKLFTDIITSYLQNFHPLTLKFQSTLSSGI